MYSFRNDYSEGALPQVLDALVRTNLESTCGYGRDAYCQQAEQTILTRFACPDAQVHFLVGGTQTNFTGHYRLSAALGGSYRSQNRPYRRT